MKKSICVFIISVLTVIKCIGQENPNNSIIANQIKTEADLLDFYRQYSSFTDPGEFKYLYKNLPDSLPELCNLVKSQFIHVFAELPKYRDQIPQERWNESLTMYPTVQLILKSLLSYDSRGLVKDRKVENRLVLACREYAMLMASILKYRGIPARVRYGFASYIVPGFHVGHTICEVWNKKENRWMLVDPTMNMVGFNRDMFDFSNDVWIKLMKKEIDQTKYGVMGHTGESMIINALNSDIASLLGTEYTFFQYSPIMGQAIKNEEKLSEEQIRLLNRISNLMTSIDAKSISELNNIYENNPQIQITKLFEFNTKTSDNNTKAKNTSINKPDIEFVDIPGGTFIMGSPVTEQERKDDEIQHEVTLSAFKMSKYLVTFEQYDIFCEATGRTKPWGRERGNLPVSQVTWDDAAAFAEWMGCRLPTEAEWEYAARANTTTPFYTGDHLTFDQANFNGSKALPVGSFPPNAFGLYDMHGNIWQWTNDTYGEYNVNEKINPKGSDKGTNKIIRGGGWRNSAWECRSAYRGDGGLFPGTRGLGIGFRLVKDK